MTDNKFMLDEKDVKILESILGCIIHPIYVYGSRVKGTAKRFSDIDLYIEGYLSDEALSNLNTQLEESCLSIKVDIKNQLSPEFLKSIRPDFVPFFAQELDRA